MEESNREEEKKGQRKATPKVKAGKFAQRSKKRKEPEPPDLPPAVADASEDQPAGEFPDNGPVQPGDPVEAEPEPAQDMEISDEMTLQEVKDLVCQNQVAEAPAEDAVPPPPPPPSPPPPHVSRAEPAEPRVRRAEILDWTEVMCPYCNSICGQVKYDPNPGNREPIWVMRVKDVDGQWPSQGKLFRRRLTRLIGESADGAKKWCRSQRTCCETNKEVDFPSQKARKM